MKAKMSAQELASAQKEADERMRAHWHVENGVLVHDGQGDSLVSAKDYKNFELLVDWKIGPAGDSGIYLRGTPQINIWDTKEPKYKPLGAEKGSGGLWNNKKHERFPRVNADNSVGEWNHMRVKLVGDRVTVHLNGKLVTDNVVLENYWEPNKPLYPAGPIELQTHPPKIPLYFRNIYIKELP